MARDTNSPIFCWWFWFQEVDKIRGKYWQWKAWWPGESICIASKLGDGVGAEDTVGFCLKHQWYPARWWFETFFIFTPNFGEGFQFDEHIFQMGWNHQPVNLCLYQNHREMLSILATLNRLLVMDSGQLPRSSQWMNLGFGRMLSNQSRIILWDSFPCVWIVSPTEALRKMYYY